jgi:hypothetical protein
MVGTERFSKSLAAPSKWPTAKSRSRAIRTKSEGLRDAVDRAYLDKYSTASALTYAKGLCRAKSRATTIEVVPLSSIR